MNTLSTVLPSIRQAKNSAIATEKGVAAARTDSNNVAIFTRLIKKAEEVAQSAI